MLRGWVKDKRAALHGSTHSLNSTAELQECMFLYPFRLYVLTCQTVESALKGTPERLRSLKL